MRRAPLALRARLKDFVNSWPFEAIRHFAAPMLLLEPALAGLSVEPFHLFRHLNEQVFRFHERELYTCLTQIEAMG